MKNITWTKFLFIAQTKLRSIVDLGTDRAVWVKLVLASQTKSGGIGTSSPGYLNTSLKVGVDFLEDGSSEFLTIVTALQSGLNDKFFFLPSFQNRTHHFWLWNL